MYVSIERKNISRRRRSRMGPALRSRARLPTFGRLARLGAGFKIQTKRAQADRLLYADAEKLLHFESDPAKVSPGNNIFLLYLACG